MTANDYKKAIETARTYKHLSSLTLILEEVKQSCYNDEITTDEYIELRKMIFGF